MKMKRILGMALSAVLAFGLAFGVAPAEVAEANAPTTTQLSVKVLDPSVGQWGTYMPSDLTASISTLATITGTVFIQIDAVSPVKEGATPATGFDNVVEYTIAFEGEGAGIGSGAATLTVPVPSGFVGTDASLYSAYAHVASSPQDITSQISNVSSTETSITFSVNDVDTTNFKQYLFNVKSTSSSGTTPSSGSSSGGSSSSGSSSGDSSSSGSSSGSSSSGGSSMSVAQIMAIAQAATGGTTTTASTPVEAAKATPDMSANSSIDKATVKTSANGTAKISNIKSEAKSIEIDSTVEVNGVSYKVKTLGKGALKSCDEVKTVTVPTSVNKFEEGAFTGADNLKTVKINTKKAVKVEKGAFDGLNTSKMTIKVSKKMSDKEFAKLQKILTKACYKGKVTSSL